MTRLDDRACPHIIAHSRCRAAARRLVALAPDQCRSLLDDLAMIADRRQRRGRRYALGAVLAVAVAAVLAGAKSLAAIGRMGWLLTRPSRSWPRSGRAATRCTEAGGHQPRPPSAACWPASTPTRWTRSSAGG
jgi:hypothetical protein